MITSTRIGRYGNLCNSMFQFAAVLGMAKKCNYEVAIPHNKTYYDVNKLISKYGLKLNNEVLNFTFLATNVKDLNVCR